MHPDFDLNQVKKKDPGNYKAKSGDCNSSLECACTGGQARL